MTDAETRLWQSLRGRRLGGYKFRRQRPIGPYIVDFICLEKELIVEIDGGHHRQRAEEDDKRSEYLENRGYRVIRFWDNEVLKENEAVLDKILTTLAI